MWVKLGEGIGVVPGGDTVSNSPSPQESRSVSRAGSSSTLRVPKPVRARCMSGFLDMSGNAEAALPTFFSPSEKRTEFGASTKGGAVMPNPPRVAGGMAGSRGGPSSVRRDESHDAKVSSLCEDESAAWGPCGPCGAGGIGVVLCARLVVRCASETKGTDTEGAVSESGQDYFCWPIERDQGGFEGIQPVQEGLIRRMRGTSSESG